MKWVWWLVLGYAVLTLVPDAPFAVGGSLDSGWMYGLNLAAHEGLRFGRDVAFTYGPWGHLLYPLPPQLNLAGYAALMSGLLLVIGVSAALMVRRLGREAAWAAGLLWLCGLLGYQVATELPELALVGAGMAGLALVRSGAGAGWPMAGLAALTSIGFLTKGTHFLLGVGLMATLALAARRDWRAMAAGATVLPAAMTLTFGGDGQACGQYLWAILQLSAGYSESMTLAGPWPVYHQGFLAAAMLLAGVPLLARTKQAWPGIAMALPLAVLAFRHGFTRQDQHSDPFLIRLALAAAFILVVMPKGWGRLVLGVGCILAALQGAAYLRYSGAPVYARAADHLMLSGLRQTLQMSGRDLERNARNQLPAWPQEVRRHVNGKTVEVVPFQTWRIAAEHLRWRPRPVFQTYSAYTPGLDRWNAEFLHQRGADVIVHEGGVIDDRQLLWEDPASSLAMASRYRVVERSEAQLVLERTSKPRLGSPAKLSEAVARWGQDVVVPAVEGLPVASAEIELHPAGRLYSLLVRTPAVNARVRMTNGYTVSRRVVFRNLQNGVATDLFDNSLDALAGFVEGDAAGLRSKVHMVAFETGSAWAFRPQIPVVWHQVKRLEQAAVEVAPLGKPAWTPAQGPAAIWSGGPAGLAAQSGTASVQWPISGDAQTVVVRVRTERPAVVALSWGDHGGPNRMETDLPRVSEWQDIYFQTRLAANWRKNRGSSLGLQIQTEPGARVQVEGLWLLDRKPPQPWMRIQVWPSQLDRAHR